MHITAVRAIGAALREAFGDGFDVTAQFPLGLGERNDPEPDALVYDGCDPGPQTEIPLLVEVSDTTLAFDRTVKARLYALHGVPEYWNLNFKERALEIRRRPPPLESIPKRSSFRKVIA